MPAYSISYDISQDSKVTYEDIETTIKDNCSGYCKYAESSWLVSYSGNASSLSKKLISLGFGKKDSLLVIKTVNDKHGWLTQSQWDTINSFFN